MSRRDIAAYYGMTVASVRKWSKYPDFPKPCAVVSGWTPLYKANELHAWVAERAVRNVRFARPKNARRKRPEGGEG